MVENFQTLPNLIVIGVITKKTNKYYIVDINSALPAKLSILAFEGASKRSRPILEEGDVVLCKIQHSARGSPALLTCVSESRKDWSSGNAEYGKLERGTLVRSTPSFCKELLETSGPSYARIGNRFKLRHVNPEHHQRNTNVLSMISKFFDFQIVIGMNGYLWINTMQFKNLLAIKNILEECTEEKKSNHEMVIGKWKNLLSMKM